MAVQEVEISPGKVIKIETGNLARLANGSALVSLGETVVLATAVAKNESVFQDFLPLQIEYREKYSAAGRFPGGFIKREGRPSEKEILSSRLIDRALRPLFPEGYTFETQILITVFSSDNINDADILGGVAASAALTVSDIPFHMPMAEVRVSRLNGEFIVNPTKEEKADSDMEICIGGTMDTICMIEGEMKEVSEHDIIEAIQYGHKCIQKICQSIEKLREEVGKSKQEFSPLLPSDEDKAYLATLCADKLKDLAKKVLPKPERTLLKKEIYKDTLKVALEKYTNEITPEVIAAHPEKEILLDEKFLKKTIQSIEKEIMRTSILSTKKRIDGRSSETIRNIDIKLGLLPRTHGSALFTRGETQALVTLTLGSKKDSQITDTIFDETEKKFMLHYNFPPSSVGEVGRIMGVGRREVGHGNLAERAIKSIMPSSSDFPYTIRIVSDILESNGSSSMATICGATLASMDGGVPIKKSVSGIAMGLIKEENDYIILSDILGDEDHLGDMDFKVAGTRDGITACQMDIKMAGLDYTILKEALEQARIGRLFILDEMTKSISSSRDHLSKYAPKLKTITIPKDTIGLLIGKGGETIRALCELTNSQIDINDEGNVTIASIEEENQATALKFINAITKGIPDLNETYVAKVKEIRDELGAIVEFVPGFPNGTGLVHFSEIGLKENEHTSDRLKVGDNVTAKLIRISKDKRTGRAKFGYSIKQAINNNINKSS